MKNLLKKIKSMWSTPLDGRYLTFKEILAFGGSSLGYSFIINIIWAVITVSQISEIYQISVLHGPIIFVIASVIGLIAQPVFGKVLQRTKTRIGKYKPFILILAPLISVCAIAFTWLPQNLTETNKLIYVYCTSIPTLVMWNLFNNTFQMLPAVITPNQQERTDVWSPIGLIVGFAPTVINVIKGWVIGYFTRQGNAYLAYRYMGLISIVFGLALVLLILKVRERVYVTEEESKNEKVGLFEGLKLVMKNKPLMVLSLALVLGCMRTAIDADIEVLARLRYATNMATGYEVFSSLSLIVGFAATPNMILLPLLTRKFSSKTIMMFWGTCNAIGYGIMACIGFENLPQGAVSATVITALRFIALFNAMGSLLPLMLSELYDYQQFVSGKRLEGFIQTFAMALVTLATNVGLLSMAFVKKGVGYEPKNYFDKMTVPTEIMNVALKYYDIAVAVSAISAVLMVLVLAFYKLGKKEHAEIVKALQEKNVNDEIKENSPVVNNETDIVSKLSEGELKA